MAGNLLFNLVIPYKSGVVNKNKVDIGTGYQVKNFLNY
jgi:hypothetical protein